MSLIFNMLSRFVIAFLPRSKCILIHVQVGFRKGRRTRDQIANDHWIIENSRLDVLQVRVKIAERNNLRYADDTTLMAESKEELKSLLMKVKEESEKADLKLNFKKTKIMPSSPITS